MSKDTATLNDLPLPKMDDAGQSSFDQFSSFLSAPARKLDADEYTANDLDGVTESATGSGNLNFLMMQAGQTNEAMNNLNPFNIAGGNSPDHGNNYAVGGIGAAPATDNGFDAAMDRPFDTGNALDSQGTFGNNNATNTNAGSISASNLSANTESISQFGAVQNFSSSSSTDTTTSQPPIPPTNGLNGSSGSNGTDGDGGSNGTNGTDGTDGNGGPITTIINNVTENIDNTTTNLFDTVNNATTNIFDTVNNTTTNLFDTINNTTNNITDIVNNITDGGLGPIGINLDLLLDNLTNIKLDGILGDTVTNILNETINLAPVLNPVESLLGNLMSGTSLGVLLNPFQPDNSPNDYDLHLGTDLDLLGLHVPDIGLDIPLDPIEALVGDLDIRLDLTNDLIGGVPVVGDLVGGLLGGGGNGDTDLALGGLGGLLDAGQVNAVAEIILNPVENLVGDVDIGGAIGLDLLGLDSGQTGPDSDLSIPLDLGILDNPILANTLDIPLDPLENIVGDIDLNLGVAGNLLGDIAAPMFDAIAGGNGQNDLLHQIGDGLSDTVGDLVPFGGGGDTDLALNTGIDLLDHGVLNDGLGLALNPVEDLAGDIDIGGSIGLDLLGTNDTSGTDTDISIPLDIDFIDNPLVGHTIDISLDPVEHLTGDIDLNLGVAGNLLGDTAGGLIDTAMGGSDSCSPLSLIGDGLSDLAAPLAPTLSGIVEPPADSALADLNSILDSITGSLDPVIDSAVSLVDSALPGTGSLDLGALTGGLGGGAGDAGGITAWTETLLPSSGDLLGGGLGADPVSIIPDPVIATVNTILPLPILPAAPVIGGGGLLGGLGGHSSHHGGLFG